jgi:hypothetical protein
MRSTRQAFAATLLAGVLSTMAHAAPVVVNMSGTSAVNNNNIFGGGSGSTHWAGQTVTLVNPLSLTLSAGDYTIGAAGSQGLFRAFQAQTDYLFPHAFTNNFVIAVESTTQPGDYDVLQHDHIAGDPNGPYDFAWDTEQEAYDAFQGLSWNLHLAQSTTLFFAVASSFIYDQPDTRSGTSIVINSVDNGPPPTGRVPEPTPLALLASALAAAAWVRRRA